MFDFIREKRSLPTLVRCVQGENENRTGMLAGAPQLWAEASGRCLASKLR